MSMSNNEDTVGRSNKSSTITNQQSKLRTLGSLFEALPATVPEDESGDTTNNNNNNNPHTLLLQHNHPLIRKKMGIIRSDSRDSNKSNGSITSKSSTSSISKRRERSLTEKDLKTSQQQHSELVSISMADDVTMEDVARIMREEDAQLLESMNFEKSCSTGETPVLTSIPADINRVEDIVPLNFEVKVGEPIRSQTMDLSSPTKQQQTIATRNNNHGGVIRRSVSLGEGGGDGGHDQNKHNNIYNIALSGRPFSQGDLGVTEKEGGKEDVVYRQCLSGEIKSFRASPQPSVSPTKSKKDVVGSGSGSNDDDYDDDVLPEGEETTISSTCCSHDATVSPSLPSVVDSTHTPHHSSVAPCSGIGGGGTTSASSCMEDKKRRNISNDQRRMNEAVQFAQAVGEMPPMDSNELCIIEEDDDDDTDDDDDDDDGNGTVIRLDEIGSQMGSVHDHYSINSHDALDAVDGLTQHSVPSNNNLEKHDENPPIPREIIKRKSRPQWPLRLPGWTFSHLDSSAHASLEYTGQDFVYKGIHSNPPEIVSRGISRGNHVQLHRKAWLEVSDKYHRYGKNLRLYYRYWESLGFPTNMFFDWLDSKGEAAGQPLPNLDECPRSKLDSDTVLYITNPEVTEGYALSIVTVDGKARLIDVDGELVRTGQDGWIFVLRDNVIYGAEKVTSINGQSKQRFHHSSFFGGKAVAAAGIIITDDEGFLTRLYPHSGHYRPREAHMQRLLYFLYHQGVDLRSFDMDVQQIFHVSREAIDNDKKDGKDKTSKKDNDKNKKEEVIDATDVIAGDNNEDGDDTKKEVEKKKKIDSLQLMPAVSVACYVAHKAHFIGHGIFSQIHKIRNANVTSVSEALELVNGEKRTSISNVGANNS